MALAQGGIEVEGLKELAKALKSLDERHLTNELKAVNFRAASEVVAEARGNTSSRMQASAASRLKATKTAAYAAVRLGGRPFDLGAEFGAVRGILRQTGRGVVTGWNQFEAWKGNGGDAGYFLYPAIRSKVPELMETYGDEVEKITDKMLGRVS